MTDEEASQDETPLWKRAHQDLPNRFSILNLSNH